MLLPSIHLFLSSLPPLSLSLSLSLSGFFKTLPLCCSTSQHCFTLSSLPLSFAPLLSAPLHSFRPHAPSHLWHCWVCVASGSGPDTLKVFSRSSGSVGKGGRAGRGCRWRALCRRETGCAALRQELRRVMLHELIGFRTETPHASPPQCGPFSGWRERPAGSDEPAGCSSATQLDHTETVPCSLPSVCAPA